MLTCVIICVACNNKHSNIDKFYTDKGDGDIGRIPLLKPYEAEIVTKDYGWCISLKGKYSGIGFCNVKKVNVIDSVVFVYTGNTILNGMDVKNSWHIIIPKNDFEKGFSSNVDYLSYLKEIGIKSAPRLHNIDSIANYFDEHNFIDWKVINSNSRF